MNIQKMFYLAAPSCLLFSSLTLAAPPLPGAIFTTLEDGSRINANLYELKEDVYLDGGPGPNAPASAAGLPAGDYYFQVTDPSGKDLLSSDHISCRSFQVNNAGVIDTIHAGYDYLKSKGDWVKTACQHAQGTDIDHPELGAITVQLFPYDDTPNPGGVYKVWITQIGDYAGDPDLVPVKMNDDVNGELWQPGNAHGFIPAKSKTDNYKVKKRGKPFVSPLITVLKFHDKDINGAQDAGEEFITGWQVDVTDPIAVTNTVYTPAQIEAALAGIYSLNESLPGNSMQTVSLLDGNTVSLYPTANPQVDVNVAGESGETHEVIYGNVGLGDITACKYYDRNADGTVNVDEPGISGWKMELSGYDVKGQTVYDIQLTGSNGCVNFSNLLPGSYTVTELIPLDGIWQATGDASFDITITSTINGASVVGSSETVAFTNICFAFADFDTKGYWHNKNGLAELTQSDINYVNSLTPYASESSYFADGDEPFDGLFTNANPVAAARGISGELLAGEGTWQAEVSYFLVDANGDGGQQEQLAQQLLAFIFNTQHRLDNPGAGLELPDGSYSNASALIDDAITAWSGDDTAQWTTYSSLLDAFNNNDAVNYVPYGACEVVYP